MIRIGTSGFSYKDWVGPVYPQELPQWQWLPYYAQSFDTVELNVTYYRLPTAKMGTTLTDSGTPIPVILKV